MSSAFSMKCNLVVAGFAKCGTTSLHKYLDLHPRICMSSRKEPHYFSLKAAYAKGSGWYDSLFDHSTAESTLFGESSTSYSTWEPASTVDPGDIRVEANKTSDKRVQRGRTLGFLYRKLPEAVREKTEPCYRTIKKRLGSKKLVAPEPSGVLLDELRVLLKEDFRQYEQVKAL